jgi:hypothetical protein
LSIPPGGLARCGGGPGAGRFRRSPARLFWGAVPQHGADQGPQAPSQIAPILLSLGLFALSIWAITSELRQYHLQDILNGIAAIPSLGTGAGVLLMVVNYGFLTGYDAGDPLCAPSPALSKDGSGGGNQLCHQQQRGLCPAQRQRHSLPLLHYLGPDGGANWPNHCLLQPQLLDWPICGGGLVFAVEPLSVPGILHLPFATVHPLGVMFLGDHGGLFDPQQRQSAIPQNRGWVLPHLPLNLSLAQIAVTSCDWALAAAVLYVLLPAHPDLNYFIFFGSYLLAQIAGIISNVPGGLGVFETVLLLLISPPIASDQLLGALLVYRVVYYFLPLLVGAGLLGFYELGQQNPDGEKLNL